MGRITLTLPSSKEARFCSPAPSGPYSEVPFGYAHSPTRSCPGSTEAGSWWWLCAASAWHRPCVFTGGCQQSCAGAGSCYSFYRSSTAGEGPHCTLPSQCCPASCQGAETMSAAILPHAGGPVLWPELGCGLTSGEARKGRCPRRVDTGHSRPDFSHIAA